MQIEVKARYGRQTDGGSKKVTEKYIIDALTCTEAEARAIEELRPYVAAGSTLSVTSAVKLKIAEVMANDGQGGGGRWFKVKVNMITIDEKTGKEKHTAVLMLVEGALFEDALARLRRGMATTSDYEIENIATTDYVDWFGPKQ